MRWLHSPDLLFKKLFPFSFDLVRRYIWMEQAEVGVLNR